jgi:hypothetical protein
MEDLDVTGSCVIHSLAELFLVSPLLNMSLNASNDEEKRKQLLSVAVAVLNQALDLVENRLTDDSQLSVSAQHLSGSTIGVCCFLSGCDPYRYVMIRQTPSTCS